MPGQLERRGPLTIRLAPRRVRTSAETQGAETELNDPRETQRDKLREMQREHSYVLTELGVTPKAIAAARKQYRAIWRPEYGKVNEDTLFTVSRGEVRGPWHQVEYLQVTKLDRQDEQWTVEVGHRYKVPHRGIGHNEGFDVKDVGYVGDLVDELVGLKESGKLPNLTSDLSKIN